MRTSDNDLERWVYCDTLYTPYQMHSDCLLQIRNGRVAGIHQKADAPEISRGQEIYVPGATVAPGLIDLHVHGAVGRDLMDGTLQSLLSVSAGLASHGTTSFLPTTFSATDADLENVVCQLAAHCGSVTEGACPIGIHLEGPYLNPLRCGTHDPSCLREADLHSFHRLLELSGNSIRRITIAPEMDSGLRLTRAAVRNGIQVSMGHTDATFDQARKAVEAGATQATHTFNCMRPFHHREPGVLGLILTDDRVHAEIVADGVHVHTDALRLLFRTKGIDRTILVTDGISAVDMPDGRYALGPKSIEVVRGECRDGAGRLAGSTLTLDQAVRNLVDWMDVPLHEALTAASATPARSMGLKGKGVIAAGADADLVFLDSDLRVAMTMVAGRIVYSRPSS